MPIEDRWSLVKLARKYGFLIVADEVYHLLDWSQQRPARFSILDHLFSERSEFQTQITHSDSDSDVSSMNKGCSVSVTSFTKIFTPGVRIGFIEGPTSIIDSIVNLGYIQSQGACAPFVGNIMRTALTEGIQDRILDNLIASYKERSDILCDILETEPGIKIHKRPSGGYFVWIDFLNMNTDTFYSFCLGRGLKFMPGIKCDPMMEDNFEMSMQEKGLCQHSARLCFADMDKDDIAEGAHLLVTLYREYAGKL